MLLTELLDTKMDIRIDKSKTTSYNFRTTTTINDTLYAFECSLLKLNMVAYDLYFASSKPEELRQLEATNNEVWEISFFNADRYGARNYDLTGKNNALKVFSFVNQSAKMFTEKYHPTYISFTSDSPAREQVYMKMISRSFKIKHKHKFKSNSVTLFVIEL